MLADSVIVSLIMWYLILLVEVSAFCLPLVGSSPGRFLSVACCTAQYWRILQVSLDQKRLLGIYFTFVYFRNRQNPFYVFTKGQESGQKCSQLAAFPARCGYRAERHGLHSAHLPLFGASNVATYALIRLKWRLELVGFEGSYETRSWWPRVYLGTQ